MSKHHNIVWVDSGREPQCPPNPAFPNGVVSDISGGAENTCDVSLPYPAKRCGQYVIKCGCCKSLTIVTTAGRPDDPKLVRLGCKELPN